jgi:hypothetical protein
MKELKTVVAIYLFLLSVGNGDFVNSLLFSRNDGIYCNPGDCYKLRKIRDLIYNGQSFYFTIFEIKYFIDEIDDK